MHKSFLLELIQLVRMLFDKDALDAALPCKNTKNCQPQLLLLPQLGISLSVADISLD